MAPRVWCIWNRFIVSTKELMWNREGKDLMSSFSLFNALYITSRKGCIDKHLVLLFGVQVFYKSCLGALNPNDGMQVLHREPSSTSRSHCFWIALRRETENGAGSSVQFSRCHIQPVIINQREENESKERKRGMTHLQCFFFIFL